MLIRIGPTYGVDEDATNCLTEVNEDKKRLELKWREQPNGDDNANNDGNDKDNKDKIFVFDYISKSSDPLASNDL